MPDRFTIFHRDHVGFWRLIFLARVRNNESARSAQRKAEQHYCDLRHEVHGLIPNSKAFGFVLAGSLPQASEVSKAINARVVSIRPPRLHRVTAYQIEADKLKTFVGMSDVWPRDVAQHIWFAAAGSAGTRATQYF